MTKKYILTEAQLQTLRRIIAFHANKAGLEVAGEIYKQLKPVGPMSLDEIKEQSHQIFGFWGEEHSVGVRATERHHFGELK